MPTTAARYQQLIADHGNWRINSARSGRETIKGLRPETTRRIAEPFVGRLSRGKGGGVWHTYLDLDIEHPHTGERKTIRVEKEESVKGRVVDDAFLASRKGATHQDIRMTPGSHTVGSFVRNQLLNHRNTYGLSSVERYRLASTNCQAYALAGITALAGEREAARQKEFVYEPGAAAIDGTATGWVINKATDLKGHFAGNSQRINPPRYEGYQDDYAA